MIRKADVSDAASIARIKVDGWKKTYRGIISDEYLDNLSYEGSTKKMAELLSKNIDSSNIIVYDDGKVLGFSSYYKNNDKENNHSYDSEMVAIYMDYDYKSCGIGTKIINYVKDDLKQRGCKNMIVWCLKDNKPSLAFYEKNGGIIKEFKSINIGNEEVLEVGIEFIL